MIYNYYTYYKYNIGVFINFTLEFNVQKSDYESYSLMFDNNYY